MLYKSLYNAENIMQNQLVNHLEVRTKDMSKLLYTTESTENKTEPIQNNYEPNF